MANLAITRKEFELIFGLFFLFNDRVSGAREKSNEAIYTFVALDQNGGPIELPKLIPETEEEKSRYEGALRRRQLSLILAGKLKSSEATELKKLFLGE